jgi:hypothetical protein
MKRNRKETMNTKRTFVIIALLAQLAMTGAVLAHPAEGCHEVDFGEITTTTDITLPNSYTLNGVTLSYDNFGSTDDTAAIDSSGIHGTTYGALIFGFSAPATGLYFDFSLLGAVTSNPGPQSIDDALVILTYNGGNFVDFRSIAASFTPYDSQVDPTLGDALGNLAYSGAAFDQAIMYFSTVSPNFSVTDVCYQPVPEPTTIVLLATGLFGLGSRRLFGRKY